MPDLSPPYKKCSLSEKIQTHVDDFGIAKARVGEAEHRFASRPKQRERIDAALALSMSGSYEKGIMFNSETSLLKTER